MTTRKSWDSYFLDLAEAASTRATCDRKHVGCVLVRGRSVVATGYNGSVKGLPHCDEIGHDLVDSVGSDGKLAPNCVRTVHAEANAIAQAARHGTRIEGATAYVTVFPCWPCFRLLANAGVARVVYGSNYREDPRVRLAAAGAGVVIEPPFVAP